MNLLSNLNCVVSKRSRLGSYSFEHVKGSHDDIAYAPALAVWAARGGGTVIMMKYEPPKDSGWLGRERGV